MSDRGSQGGSAVGRRRARKPIMAEVDGQQKASDACGGRVSHERGWRTRGQDVPGPINCTRRSPSSLSRSSASLFFFLLYLRFFSFIGTAVFLAIAFLRSIAPTPKLAFPRETRDHLTLVMCIGLYFTPLITPILASLCSTYATPSSCRYTFVTDVYL